MGFWLTPLFGGATTIGKLAATAAGSLLGGAVDRHNDRRARQNEFSFYKSQGATLSEIMGNGGVGTGSNAATAVLGNQQAELTRIREQQQYDADQRNLDRAVQIRAQDTQRQNVVDQVGATLQGQQNQFDIAMAANSLQMQKIANEWAVNNPQLNMQLKQMTMGVENVQVEMILKRNGINLGAQVPLSKQEFNRRMSAAMGEIAALKGVGATAREGVREFMAEGNDLLGNSGWSPQNYVTPKMPLTNNFTLGR